MENSAIVCKYCNSGTIYFGLNSDRIESLWDDDDTSESDFYNDYAIPYRGGSKMTLALAFIGKDGIVMATDSAKTYIDNEGKVVRVVISKKLYPLCGQTGLAVVSEQAGQSEWMIRQFNANVQATYSDTLATFVQRMKEQWSIFTKDMPAVLLRDRSAEMIFILCGYNQEGNPSIIQSVSTDVPDIFMPNIFDKYCIAGLSGEANYWMRKIDDAHINIEQTSIGALKQLCVFLIKETAERSPFLVKEPIQMLTVTKRNGVSVSTDEDIIKLCEDTRELSSVDRIVKMLKSN